LLQDSFGFIDMGIEVPSPSPERDKQRKQSHQYDAHDPPSRKIALTTPGLPPAVSPGASLNDDPLFGHVGPPLSSDYEGEDKMERAKQSEEALYQDVLDFLAFEGKHVTGGAGRQGGRRRGQRAFRRRAPFLGVGRIDAVEIPDFQAGWSIVT
jgi:hypothetical protein